MTHSNILNMTPKSYAIRKKILLNIYTYEQYLNIKLSRIFQRIGMLLSSLFYEL